MPSNNTDRQQSRKNGSSAERECFSLEQIEKTLDKKLNERFAERFNSLKDNLITLVAEKQSSLIEENHSLQRTLTDEVEDLHGWQNDINQEMDHLRKIEIGIESEKKQRTVIHELVKTFNKRLTEIEENSKQSIQGVEDDVQSIKENVCEMLKEVPQVTMSSLETRFNNIEEKLSLFSEPVESKNSVNSLSNVHPPYNNSSRLTVTRMSNK